MQKRIAATKRDMLGTTPWIDFVYVLIGEFIVKFSQIEVWLRLAFGLRTKLQTESSDPILSKPGFQSLVVITTSLYEPLYVKVPAPWKRMCSLFSQYSELNDAQQDRAWFLGSH